MKFTLQILSAIAVFALTVAPATAQQATTQERAGNTQRSANNTGKLDSKTRGANIRVSQLMGYNIQNSQGESVGEIKDIVLDTKSGKVKYAAVTYGGFLGVGNKMFAVPFDAFQVKLDKDEVDGDDFGHEADDYVLILDVTQKQLEGQQGFDEDNWPNMADRQWARDLDKRYGVNRNMDAKDRLLRENRRNNN